MAQRFYDDKVAKYERGEMLEQKERTENQIEDIVVPRKLKLREKRFVLNHLPLKKSDIFIIENITIHSSVDRPLIRILPRPDLNRIIQEYVTAPFHVEIFFGEMVYKKFECYPKKTHILCPNVYIPLKVIWYHEIAMKVCGCSFNFWTLQLKEIWFREKIHPVPEYECIKIK